MKNLGRRLQATFDYLKAQWGHIGASLIIVALATFLSLSFAPGTAISIPFNLLVALFVAVGSAVMLPVVLILQIRQEQYGSVSEFVDKLRRDLDILKEVEIRAKRSGIERELEKEKLVAIDKAKAIALRLGRELSANEERDIQRVFEERLKLGGRKHEDQRKQLADIFVRGVTPQTDWWVYPETGTIIHGGMRHVLFRIGTIQEILLAVSEPDDSIGVDDRLRELGLRMGSGFAKDFLVHLQDEELYAADLDVMISRWCEFDVSGGWGKFQWYPDSETEDEGKIRIDHNFLTAQADPPVLKDKSLCRLMEGYIRGVLEILAQSAGSDPSWRAEVKEVGDCGILSDGKKPCEFEVKLQRTTQTSDSPLT